MRGNEIEMNCSHAKGAFVGGLTVSFRSWREGRYIGLFPGRYQRRPRVMHRRRLAGGSCGYLWTDACAGFDNGVARSAV